MHVSDETSSVICFDELWCPTYTRFSFSEACLLIELDSLCSYLAIICEESASKFWDDRTRSLSINYWDAFRIKLLERVGTKRFITLTEEYTLRNSEDYLEDFLETLPESGLSFTRLLQFAYRAKADATSYDEWSIDPCILAAMIETALWATSCLCNDKKEQAKFDLLFRSAEALLHKSSDRRTSPIPGQTHPTA